MKKIAVITGATGGLGGEFVKQLLKKDIDEIWAVARNEQKLAELREGADGKVITFSVDLTSLTEIMRFGEIVKERKPLIRYLVNNAGQAYMGESKEHTMKEVSNLIDVNCKAPVLLSNLCIPFMDKDSKILNISSASAFQPDPYINLYAASKVFERSYSRALNVELRKHGITVTAVCPGWVDTDLLQEEIDGKKVDYPGIVRAEDVVKLAIRDADKGKDMSICSLYVKCEHIVVKLLPQKLIMKIWMKQIGKYGDY